MLGGVSGHAGLFSNANDLAKIFQMLLNKGALTKTYDEHITVRGLSVIANGIDVRKFLVYGLHGQIAFFYVKNLRIEDFRCEDIGKAQYGIHVCTFEDLLIENVLLKGDKDLSFGERKMLDTARSLLIKELAFAKGVTEQDIENDLKKIFNMA